MVIGGRMQELTRRALLCTALVAPALMRDLWGETQTQQNREQPKRFEEVGGFEVEDLTARHLLAILPLGSLEFHGPHNPLGADSIIISGIAEKVSVRTKALLLPTVMFTLCPSHTAAFRGTMSVRPEVMTMYFADILRNTLQLGFKKIFVL